MTPLHYHIKRLAGRLPRLKEDVELIRKMVRAPISMTQESLQSLELVRADPSLPADLNQIIFGEINKYCIKVCPYILACDEKHNYFNVSFP